MKRYSIPKHILDQNKYVEILVCVGSGFSDEQREIFEGAENCDIVEIKYQEHTKDGSLRFPVFVKERPDLT